MIYMFCYDISDDRRLRKVAKVLEKYGLRIQKSFFQANLKSEIKDKIRDEILKIIDKKQDSFFIYPICDHCSLNAQTDGSGTLLKIEQFEII